MKFLVLSMLTLFMSAQASADEVRCGWISNPTPSNYWLDDADGEWTIGKQGGYQAEGYIENYPEDEHYVNTNGSYGYWCGCVKGTFNKQTMRVVKITGSSAKTLDICLEDPNLPSPN